MASFQPHPSSYRDPSGFVFYKDDILYRQVNISYKEDFLRLMGSGLFDALVQQGKLLPTRQLDQNLTGSADWYCTLQPDPLPFITYPYEWSFAMLKDAALLTLDIMKEAMAKGMILKDATPYNVQLLKGKMIFIDTLSFERYDETKPWIAYRQFCETFLLPLALMHYTRQPLQPLLLAYPDGIPLSLGKSLLPLRSKWNLNAYLHLHLNAKVIHQTPDPAKKQVPFSAKKLDNILASLKQAVLSYTFSATGVWSDYYSEANQREDYVAQKTTIIEQWLKELPAVTTAIDVGANEGLFSELLVNRNISAIAAD
ncbi:MAG TPA: hypothetical protein VFL47_17155, partial [Flavisolibacter sp.]|nr:hypothetical protein [Flavisolibacter sp.]